MSEFSNTYGGRKRRFSSRMRPEYSDIRQVDDSGQIPSNGWFVNLAKVNIKEELSIKERSISKSGSD